MTRSVIALMPVLALAACVSAEDCDPNLVDNVVTSGLCSAQGRYDERAANLAGNLGTLNAEIARERQALDTANARIDSLSAQQRLTSNQLAGIDRQMAALEQDVNRLEQGGGDSAALRRQIEERKRAINDYADIAVF